MKRLLSLALVYLVPVGLMYVFHVFSGPLLITISVLSFLIALIKMTFGSIRIYYTRKVWSDIFNVYSIMNACDKEALSPTRSFNRISALFALIIFTLSVLVDNHWFPLAAVYFSMFFEGTAIRRQPPLVLFLSSSVEDISRDLHTSLTLTTEPFFQTYSLIRIQDNKNIMNAVAKQSNWRTYNNDNWELVAFIMMDLAKIIVVDSRFVTSAAIEEAEKIAEMKTIFKTLLIVNEDGSKPLIDSLGEKLLEVYKDALQLPERKAIMLIEHIKKNLGYLPTNQMTLSAINNRLRKK